MRSESNDMVKKKRGIGSEGKKRGRERGEKTHTGREREYKRAAAVSIIIIMQSPNFPSHAEETTVPIQPHRFSCTLPLLGASPGSGRWVHG